MVSLFVFVWIAFFKGCQISALLSLWKGEHL